MNGRVSLFGALSKVEEQEDGTLMVHGIASSGARDSAGEIITPDAMRAALPGYMAYPAIREMHKSDAAGSAAEISVDDATGVTHICAHVVDPIAITKVKSKTYRGFSVGGKVLKRDPDDRSIITSIDLIEVSLVDRPCNPEASITMFKADVAETEEEAMSVPFEPKPEDTKARAAEMAKAAGKPDRAVDYLVKARDELIAAGPPPEVPAVVELLADPAQVEKAGAETPADPATALTKALEAAAAVIAPIVAVSPVTPGLADLGKGIAKLGELYGEDGLKKGFYGISYLAEAVSSLVTVQAMAASDALYSPSGGDKQSPQMLAEATQAAGQALMQLVKETMADALIMMQAGGAELEVVVVEGDEVIALAAAAVDMVKSDTALMEKAGKRNSARDQKHVQDAHDSACKAGAKCDPDNMPDAKKAADADDLQKALADKDALEKAVAAALPQIEALTKGMTDMKAELDVLKAQPMPPRTAGSSHAVVAVEKTADAGGDPPKAAEPDDIAKALAELPEAERNFVIMKAALRNGVTIA